MFGLYNFYVFIDLSVYDLLLCWYDTSSGGEAWHRRRRQTIEARLGIGRGTLDTYHYTTILRRPPTD